MAVNVAGAPRATPGKRGAHPQSQVHQLQLDSAIGKALALLGALSVRGQAGVTEPARRVGVPKSTASRLLSILTNAGLAERRVTDYCLGRRLFELGCMAAEMKPRRHIGRETSAYRV